MEYCEHGIDQEKGHCEQCLIDCLVDTVKAIKAVIPDLERFVSKHGPGPDKRLKALKLAGRFASLELKILKAEV